MISCPLSLTQFFSSHLLFAHHLWEELLSPGDAVIDATCGRGRDTLKLAEIVGEKGCVIGLDIQEEALQATRELLGPRPQVHLFKQCHSRFPPLAETLPIRLVSYNLGYLPRGNKELTTQVATTLQSLEEAKRLLQPGGILSITAYPRHPEGGRELEALLRELSALDPKAWGVSQYCLLNRPLSPTLLICNKLNLN